MSNPQTVPQTWSRVFARIMLRRLQDTTWQAVFLVPDEYGHNRCFNQNYVARCAQNEDDAYDLFISDFSHLRPDWQINLTGKTVSQWNEYDRELRKELTT